VHLRALVIGSAEIGELMMRAFILRRAALLEGGSVGSVVLGEVGSPDPNTQWLDRRIALDEKGFVATGRASGLPLETGSPGVFAIGDARSGSIKRVAAGVGEGAAAVAQIHAYLAGLRARPRALEPA
jgi:hypothetical protein